MKNQNLIHAHQNLQFQLATHQAKSGKINMPLLPQQKKRESLSTTRIAFYLLRFNVALQVAAAAIVGNLLLGVATFYYGLNALYCAFGMDCLIGVITSAILVWRFATAKKSHLDKVEESSPALCLLHDQNSLVQSSKYSELLESVQIEDEDPQDHARELWSTFWLGQVMIVAGIGVVIRTVVEIITHALANYAQKTSSQISQVTTTAASSSLEDVGDFDLDAWLRIETVPMEPLFILALISLILNFILMLLKLSIYRFLGSNSMLIEGINSGISAIFAAVAMISIRYSDSVQYLDQIVSILFGIFLIVYGGYNMLHTIGETVYRMVKTGNNSGGHINSGNSRGRTQSGYQSLV